MRFRPVRLLGCLGIAAAGAGCGGPDGAAVQSEASAVVQQLPAAADTFINSAVPDNNDGTSPSLYTGESGQSGLMRALLRFDLPAAWQGQVTVSRVVLTLVTRGTGMTLTTPPAAATESLQALTVPWQEGSGFGDSTTQNTVGQPCGTTGATWNQPSCAGGTPWSGGAVAAAASATASVPAALEAAVIWDSNDTGNAGMLADVQAWIDTPSGNQGWRIASSTEGSAGQAQRFYAREAAGKGPVLAVTATCNPELTEVDGGCAARAPGDDASAPLPDAAGGPSPGSGGGCSCSLAASPSAPAALAASLVLIGLAGGSRRRRPRQPQK